jgi:polyketide synthase 12/myxalamid-type polyketide synthase MxaB
VTDRDSQNGRRSALLQALAAIEQLENELDELKRARSEPIAIVGAGCRFPGGVVGLDSFWRLLRDGVDAVGEVPRGRWDVGEFFDPDPEVPGRMYTRCGHFVSGIDGFDAEFFGVSPREAVSLDPQQRLLLEVAWEALEDAGQVPDRLAGSPTGVFIGIGTDDYSLMLRSDDPASMDAYTGTGNAYSVAAGRLSYLLGLQGPSLAVTTACSSSLVAVHLACRSLRVGECDLALAGGVNAILAPDAFITLSRMRALSPDGRCKAFDASADGYGRGEGCGVVVLKRLSEAVGDGDRVLAVVRGSAVNHDGASGGLTVPNGLAQEALIRSALVDAGLAPGAVDVVEAHGTGTPLGDPIEVRALAAVLGEGRAVERPLVVGSVKTNIGHLEAAAGVAGLIKLVLALRHEQVPPHLHFRSPNPYVDWEAVPVRVAAGPVAWPGGGRPRVGGVSSFGMSGTNAHVVVAEAPAVGGPAGGGPVGVGVPGVDGGVLRSWWVLPLSAKSGAALRVLAGRYVELLEGAGGDRFAQVCAAAGTGRGHYGHRLAVVAADAGAAVRRLRGWLQGGSDPLVWHGVAPVGQRRRVGWLFTGQGSQQVGMAARLYRDEPVFRAALDRCAGVLEGLLDRPLTALLYPDPDPGPDPGPGPGGPGPGPDSGSADPDPDSDPDPAGPDSGSADSGGGAGVGGGGVGLLERTGYTQPVLFAVQWSLAQLWLHWGVRPDVLLGHSVGELAAACVAGVFSVEDGLRLAAARGRLMQRLPAGGQMMAVALPAQRLVEYLADEPGVVVAGYNAPAETVVAGEQAAVGRLRERLRSDGLRCTLLRVSHAFHSPLMAPMLPEFGEAAQQLDYSSPRLVLVSSLTGQVAGEEITTAGYWCDHVRAPVRFTDAVATMVGQGCTVFQEIGPHPVLLASARQCVDDSFQGTWLPSLRRGRDDWQQLMSTLAGLYTHGAAVDWQQVTTGITPATGTLPTYPFQRQRYWIDTSRLRYPQPSPPDTTDLDDWLYQLAWRPQQTAPAVDRPSNWLIFADAGGVGAAAGRPAAGAR